MHHFAVWAPERKKVTLLIDEKRLPMEGPTDEGIWSLDVEEADHGTDYAFLLDDEPKPYPDPRSMWQPKDVHSSSRVYHHTKFPWTDQNFRAVPLASAIFYEMHLGTFTPGGTLDSAIERLDYLVDLGITHLEILPVAAFDGEFSWGYDGVAPYAADEVYGGPDAVKRFVDACHSKGLAVVLDVVYNHFGPSGNYTGNFAPYLTEKHHTPWGAAINFEEIGADRVRRYFIDNALMWLRDFHFDGLRLDATHEFIDRSAMHVLEQMSREVEDLSASVGRALFLVAESDLNNPRVVASREANGYGMDAQWSDDFHHALFTLLADESGGYFVDFGTIAALAKSLKDVFVYDGKYSAYRGRSHGRPVQNISYHRFVACIQNHDQIGNRAKGERIQQIIGTKKAKMAAAILFTSPFLPLIFMGEEWAASTPWMFFADHTDEDLAKKVSEGRRREFSAFGWAADEVPDPVDRSTFEQSRLKWDELQEPEHHGMHGWYRSLIHLRRKALSLNLGDRERQQVEWNEKERWITAERGDILTLMNFNEGTHTFTVPAGALLLLSSDSAPERSGDQIAVPGYSVAVYQLPASALPRKVETAVRATGGM